MRVFFALVVFCGEITPATAQSQQDDQPTLGPLADFWDDSAWNDVIKTSYLKHTRDQVSTDTAVACVEHCLSQAGCVTFFYSNSTRECEIVPVNLLVNTNDLDDSLQSSTDGTRYYRFLPLGRGYCPMINCFYFDRKAWACWKLLLDDGPQGARGLYTAIDADQACRNEGGQLASLDNVDKLSQADRMLVNLPVMFKSHRFWKWVYIGGGRRRTPGSGSYRWLSETEVTTEDAYWTTPYAEQVKGKDYDCLILAHYIAPDEIRPTDFRLQTSNCSHARPGVLCEIPLPP